MGVTRAEVAAGALAEAIDAVRFAADAAVGLELAPDTLRTVAGGAVCLALCTVPAATEGPAVIAAAPVGLVDEARRALDGDPARRVTVTVGGGTVAIGSLDAPIAAAPPPDYAGFLLHRMARVFAAAGPGPVFMKGEKSTNPVLIRPGAGADRLFVVSCEILPPAAR